MKSGRYYLKLYGLNPAIGNIQVMMSRMKNVLLELADKCGKSAEHDPCPILKSLGDLT
jgi:hypothetical protein